MDLFKVYASLRTGVLMDTLVKLMLENVLFSPVSFELIYTRVPCPKSEHSLALCFDLSQVRVEKPFSYIYIFSIYIASSCNCVICTLRDSWNYVTIIHLSR